MGRRSDNPLSILVLGIMSIIAFGGVLVWVNKTRPILQLRPALMKEFGDTAWTTRFVPAQGFSPSYIQISVPPSLADPHKRLEIGLFALPEYIRIAEGQTRVQHVELLVKGDAEQPLVSVSRQLLNAVTEAKQRAGTLRNTLQQIGLRNVQIAVLGHTFTGANVRVLARARAAEDPDALADRAVKILSRYPYVGRCEVEIQTPNKRTSRVGGRDAPAAKKAPEPPPQAPKPGGQAPTAPEKADPTPHKPSSQGR